MSGIEELKQKTKLSMDEMYDDPSTGKMARKKAGHPDNQMGKQPSNHQISDLAAQLEKNPLNKNPGKESSQTPIHPINQESSQPDGWKAGHPAHQLNGIMDTHESGLPETQITRQPSVFPTMQMQTQKRPTCKMTFNLTEDIYKAFNDLYAKRMLQGRKTEKSELICEAIQWLIKMEEDETN